MENLFCFNSVRFQQLRSEAASHIDISAVKLISGSDIDGEALELVPYGCAKLRMTEMPLIKATEDKA